MAERVWRPDFESRPAPLRFRAQGQKGSAQRCVARNCSCDGNGKVFLSPCREYSVLQSAVVPVQMDMKNER